MEYFIDEKDMVFADAFLKKNNISPADFLIGLHPFGSLQSKSWPNYIGFLKKISDNQKIKLIVFGGKVHEQEYQQFNPIVGRNIFPLVGKTDISQTAALIRRCKVFVTTDSGPFHLAVALKTPAIMLVGPTAVDLTGPYQDREMHRIIREDVDCAPCRLKQCDEHICMKAITPERVMEELERFFPGRQEAGGAF
jgi:ADP-heptose:LPS heptosyltransferase